MFISYTGVNRSTIALLSPAYFGSKFSEAEWRAVLRLYARQFLDHLLIDEGGWSPSGASA